MTIALATDHAGFEQLKELKAYLESLGHNCQDFGPTKLQANDDYPDYVFLAAKAVASRQFERGIILGGSGQGEMMCANRLKGVRCALYYGPAVPKGVIDVAGNISHDPQEIIRLSRMHNDANMLSLATRFLTVEEIKQAAKLWLEAPFMAEERHDRRIKKMDQEA